MQGTCERTGDELILRFERHFTQTIDRLWQALTDPSELTKWIAGDEAVVELRPGGRVWFSGHGGIESTIVELDAPHVIAYGWRTNEWEGGVIRWELSEEGGGTKLSFTHRMPEPDKQEQERLMKKMGFGPEMYDPIPRNLAGWHSLIDALAVAIEGQSATQGTPQENADEPDWKKLHRMYVEAHGTNGS